jgi:hypothetical protein
MKPKDLSNQIDATYKMLRLGLAVMAFAFPIVLWAGGYFLGDHLGLAGSLSAYYHVSDPANLDGGPPGQGVMRNEFVGILFAVGALLFVYQGYSRREDFALNVAGIMAWGVALFPTAWKGFAGVEFTVLNMKYSLHGAFAISLFLAIGYVCICRAGDTLPLVPDLATRKRYRRTYKILGWAMVIFPIAAWFLLSLIPDYKSTIFFVELAAIYVFALYWAVKTHEASKTKVDQKAACMTRQGQSFGLPELLANPESQP